jgi:hypothetical protein
MGPLSIFCVPRLRWICCRQLLRLRSSEAAEMGRNSGSAYVADRNSGSELFHENYRIRFQAGDNGSEELWLAPMLLKLVRYEDFETNAFEIFLRETLRPTQTRV